MNSITALVVGFSCGGYRCVLVYSEGDAHGCYKNLACSTVLFSEFQGEIC